MRKAIIAAIVATALFAVGAFAAEFVVDAEDIASGADSVLACADEVDIHFADAVWDDAENRYETPSATAYFYDVTEGVRALTANCNDMPVNILVDFNTAAPAAESADISIANGSATFTPTDRWAVSEIEAAAVLVEDILITDTATTPFGFTDPFQPPAP